MGTIYLDGICYSSGGGGGASSADQVSLDDTNLAYVADDVQEAFEKVTKSLTYEEYEALTEEEKNNGTIYLITDVNGDGQSFQPVIYSEEEREIGVWVDGKPLYEKTFEVPYATYPPSWVEIADLTSSNVDTYIHYNSYAYIPSLNYKYPAFNTLYNSDTKKLLVIQTVSTGSSFAGSGTITARYTKTTDAAGSGQWTPQGVPAHHYSTEEQVVGTWIDGSTLYEKTFYSDMVIPYDSASVVTLNDTIPSNIEVIDIQAYFKGKSATGNQVYQSDGGKWFNYYYESSGNQIYASQIFTSVGVTHCKTYFTIRYTKSST